MLTISRIGLAGCAPIGMLGSYMLGAISMDTLTGLLGADYPIFTVDDAFGKVCETLSNDCDDATGLPMLAVEDAETISSVLELHTGYAREEA